MSEFVRDSFASPTNWVDIHTRSGELGANWTRHPSTPGSRWYLFGNRVHCGVPGVVYASGTPADADYDVECDYVIHTDLGGAALCGRMDPTAETWYQTHYQAGQVLLWKRVNGTPTTVGWWDGVLAGGGTVHKLRLSMHSTTIAVWVNGTKRIEETDASISAAGRVGLRSLTVNDAYTGKHVDNLVAWDTATASLARTHVAGLVGL